MKCRLVAARVCAVVLSFSLFLFLLEAGLAIVRINTKANDRFVPGIGPVYRPHAYYRNTIEGFSEGYFNSHGFRDYERSYVTPSGTFRILVLGDSYVEAFQVALENSFPALLEKTLNENSTSHKFEVLNLGQGGFGTSDEYMRYLNFGVRYHPDLVVLAFLTGNDFRNNSKFLSLEEVRPFFEFDKSGHLIFDRSVLDNYEKSFTLPKKIFQFVKRHSYLASLVSERLYLLKYQLRVYQLGNMLAGNRSRRPDNKLDEFSDLNIYRSDMDARWREAVAITKALLLKFKHSVEGNHERFLLVTLSNAEQLDSQIQAGLREKYGLPFDFEQPDRIIEEFAKREHITYLKLMPMFRDYHLRTGKILHGPGSQESGHWNKLGHRLAAEKIFEFLRERHLVPLSAL